MIIKPHIRLHDGDAYVHDYNYLSLEGVLRKWLMMTELSEEGVFKERKVFDAGEGIIQNTWWHRAWIPFAEMEGNLICIDLAPEA
jgi:cell wall assembly regulator SMI1